MPDPFRLRVMKSVCDTIKTVTPANGYTNDLADYLDTAGRTTERVFRGCDIFATTMPLPLIAVLEDFREMETVDERDASPVRTGPWKLLIQGFVPNDPEHPLDAAYMLGAEVIMALSKAKTQRYNILGFGSKMPCVSGMRIGQMVARPADGEVSDTAFFFLSVTLTLVEDLENPFA